MAMIGLLVELGADPGLPDLSYNATAAGWAQANRHPQAARCLAGLET
jgi:hypothetical protein